MFRLRKGRLGWPAICLLGFVVIMTVALVWQTIVFLNEPIEHDWLLLLVLVVTIAVFVVMGLAVFWLDFDQQLLLRRDGIHIWPSVFASYKISWDDIERLELREGQGFRLIEYRLRPGSPSYEAGVKRDGKRKVLATEGRNGGFHGAIPVQAFSLEINSKDEQDNVKANRLFPILYRFWTNSASRSELPEAVE